MFDWPRFLSQNRILFVTEGKNTPRGNISIKCPFCGASDPSEHMAISLSGKGWRCWRNGAHSGKHPAFLIQTLIGCSYERAMLLVQAERGTLVPSDMRERTAANLARPSNDPPPRPVYPTWPKNFRAFTEVSADPYIAYVWNRGIVAKPWELTSHYSLYFAVTGAFKGRVILPVIEKGNLISWTGRSIWPQERQRYKSLTTDPEKARSWQCDPASDAINNHVLWYDELMRAKRRDVLVLVEGPFDAVKVRYLGEDSGIHATCLFTSTPTSNQTGLLRRLRPRFKQMVILLDDDARIKALRMKSSLRDLGVKTAKIGEGDPGEIASEQQLRAIINEAVDI